MKSNVAHLHFKQNSCHKHQKRLNNFYSAKSGHYNSLELYCFFYVYARPSNAHYLLNTCPILLPF